MSWEVDKLSELLAIPSVSMESGGAEGMAAARDWLLKYFTELGLSARTLPGRHHPAVFAQTSRVDLSLPTVLIYGHYDVQPPDPINQWTSPPFQPQVRNGQIYARGATDNKGQLMVHLVAVRKLFDKFGPEVLPLNLKFLIEGEEEMGSPSIPGFVKEFPGLLSCDYIIASDTEMPAAGQPAIHISLRGLIYTEVSINTGSHDVHSGQYGGIAPNPAIIMSRLISSLKDLNNHVQIPGFYDEVENPTPDELKDFSRLEPSPEQLTAEGGFSSVGGGEPEFSLNERRWTRPTLDINGLWSGYTGEGTKTIIPSSATAKISMRLVPNQNPDRIFSLFADYVRALVPREFDVSVSNLAGALPYKAPTGNPVYKLAKKVLADSWQKEPVFYATGGSIGFVPIVAGALNVPCILFSFGQADENLHAPDEHFSLDNYSKGIRAMVEFYSDLKYHTRPQIDTRNKNK